MVPPNGTEVVGNNSLKVPSFACQWIVKSAELPNNGKKACSVATENYIHMCSIWLNNYAPNSKTVAISLNQHLVFIISFSK